LFARLEAELLGQQPAGALKGVERVGLSAAATEREHQLAPEALLERMLADEPLELRDEFAAITQRLAPEQLERLAQQRPRSLRFDACPLDELVEAPDSSSKSPVFRE